MKTAAPTLTSVLDTMHLSPATLQRRKAFLGLGEADMAPLHSLRERLAGQENHFLDAFYDHLLNFPETRRLLPDVATTLRLKQAQKRYFKQLLSGPYDWDYALERLRVGLAHQRVELAPQWYLGAYARYLCLLLDELRDDMDDPNAFLLQGFQTLLKVVFLDLGLALDTYIQADRQTIKSLKEYAEHIVVNMPSGLLVLDDELRILSANRAFQERFGWPEPELLGKPLEHILSAPILLDCVREVLESGVANAGLVFDLPTGPAPDASWPSRTLEASISLITGEGLVQDRPEARLLLLLDDISERRRAEERLHYLAMHDSLSGLPNRALFRDRLDHALARAQRERHHVALMFIDLDDFKVVNDNWGHRAGDQLIGAVATRLKTCLRESDTIARLGGDEFAVLLEGIQNLAPVRKICHKIQHSLAQPFDLSGRTARVGASIGVSRYPEDGTDADTLLQRADSAMYRAKRNGGRQCLDAGAR